MNTEGKKERPNFLYKGGTGWCVDCKSVIIDVCGLTNNDLAYFCHKCKKEEIIKNIKPVYNELYFISENTSKTEISR